MPCHLLCVKLQLHLNFKLRLGFTSEIQICTLGCRQMHVCCKKSIVNRCVCAVCRALKSGTSGTTSASMTSVPWRQPLRSHHATLPTASCLTRWLLATATQSNCSVPASHARRTQHLLAVQIQRSGDRANRKSRRPLRHRAAGDRLDRRGRQSSPYRGVHGARGDRRQRAAAAAAVAGAGASHAGQDGGRQGPFDFCAVAATQSRTRAADGAIPERAQGESVLVTLVHVCMDAQVSATTFQEMVELNPPSTLTRH